MDMTFKENVKEMISKQAEKYKWDSYVPTSDINALDMHTANDIVGTV